MRNAGNKKLLAVLLALALLACSVMALGSTLASQTEVDKKNTTEKSLLDSEGEYKVTVAYGDNYEHVLSNASPIFSAGDLWCPGYTKIVDLKITNNEEFPVEVMLNMVVGESDLNEVMYYALLGDVQPTSWGSISDDAKKLLSEGEKTIVKAENLQKGQSCDCKLAVHMSEAATNKYQNKTLDVNFELIVNANYKPGVTELTEANFN